MEKTITVLIYIHAFFGGLGLITGLISIAVKKGGVSHKKAGKVFSYAMVISALISLVIARIPGHENLFLFLIGIFTIYMVLAGQRALTLRSKTKTTADWIDKSISGAMLVASVVMISIGIIGYLQKVPNSILYVFFGGFGLFMTLKDFKTFKTFTTKKNAWIRNHIGRMMGAFIASVTAFMVAGLNIGSAMIWMLPTIAGTIYIVYFNRQYPEKKESAVQGSSNS